MCECLFGQCASVSLVNVRVVRCLHHRNVQVNMQCASASLVCESLFGRCASGLIFTTPKCARATLANVRVVWFSQHRNVRVLVWSMCEWSGHNVRVW